MAEGAVSATFTFTVAPGNPYAPRPAGDISFAFKVAVAVPVGWLEHASSTAGPEGQAGGNVAVHYGAAIYGVSAYGASIRVWESLAAAAAVEHSGSAAAWESLVAAASVEHDATTAGAEHQGTAAGSEHQATGPGSTQYGSSTYGASTYGYSAVGHQESSSGVLAMIE